MLEIEIFSDVICPWCFIGKRRLDQVLSSPVGEGIVVRWRPYQLYPGIDAEGVDRAEMLRRRYGDQADVGRVPERIDSEAKEEGIELRFDLMQRTPNTLKAHRLMELAFDHHLQHELAEALFLAYFSKGLDVGSQDVLVQLGAEVGMEPEVIEAYLTGEGGMDEVQQQLARAPELGISGVPGYYLADAFLLPGAQTSEVMAQIITRVKERIISKN